MRENRPVPLRRRDLRAAAAMCARAFVRAPHIERFFQEEAQRHAHAQELFRMRLRYGLLFGEVHTTSANLEAVAVWLPWERATSTTWRELRAGGIRLFRAVGADAVARMRQVSRHNEQLRRRSVPDPHWFLSILAVDPKHQRKGHASALVGSMLARLDADHVPCYAETTERGLLAFYERLGFQPGSPSDVPGVGLTVWPLLRSIVGS